MYTKTDYTRTKYGQYKNDNSKILTMPTYYITSRPSKKQIPFVSDGQCFELA